MVGALFERATTTDFQFIRSILVDLTGGAAKA
jgi:hypothetical protein